MANPRFDGILTVKFTRKEGSVAVAERHTFIDASVSEVVRCLELSAKRVQENWPGGDNELQR